MENYEQTNLDACNQLAIMWIAMNNKDSFMQALKNNGMPLTLTMFYAMLRSGNLDWLKHAIENCKYMEVEAINNAAIEERVYTEESYDEMLIAADAAHLASDETLQKKQLWQALAKKGSFKALKQSAEEYPELWKIIDDNAEERFLLANNRLDALSKRGMYDSLHFIEGGAQILIDKGLVKDYAKNYRLGSPGIRDIIDYLISQKEEKWAYENFGTTILTELEYFELFKTVGAWHDLHDAKKHELIDWQAWYDEQTEEYWKREIRVYARQSGYIDTMKR